MARNPAVFALSSRLLAGRPGRLDVDDLTHVGRVGWIGSGLGLGLGWVGLGCFLPG